MHRWSYAAVKKRLEGWTDLPIGCCSARSAMRWRSVLLAASRCRHRLAWHGRVDPSAWRRSVGELFVRSIPRHKGGRHTASRAGLPAKTDAFPNWRWRSTRWWIALILIVIALNAPHLRSGIVRRRGRRTPRAGIFLTRRINPNPQGSTSSTTGSTPSPSRSADAALGTALRFALLFAAWLYAWQAGTPRCRAVCGPPVSPRPASNPWWLRVRRGGHLFVTYAYTRLTLAAQR
jgi:hypothetical protein